VAAIATAIMWLGATLFPASISALVVPMVFYATGMGLVLPNAMAVALRPFPHMAGTASALLGFIQMSLSASSSALVGAFLQHTPQPVLVFMCVITLLALGLSVRVYQRHSMTNR